VKLFFVRHGESEANLIREISNRDLKHGLTEKGRQQAAALGDQLKDQGAMQIYASPVLRARQTAEILAGALGVPCEITDALREFDCGVAEGRRDAEAWKLHHDIMDRWLLRGAWDERIEQGESFNDMRRRFVPFIEKLVQARASQPGAIILVGHGALYYCMLPLILLNIDYGFIEQHGIDHTMPIVVEPGPDGLVCRSWGKTVL
jgi:broad specificity phosphatase PhoE